MSLRERATSLLATRHAPWWIAALAFVLLLPALATGYVLDDHMQHLMLTDAFPLMSRRPDQLYAFMLSDPAWQHSVREMGLMPWFTSPDMFVSFWRPLSSLTLAFDQLVAPYVAPFAHLHSMLWYAGLVVVTGALYRRLLEPRWLAGLATLMFAIDDAHGFGTAWIANRHALISLLFGTAALVFHVRWRRDGERRAGWLAPGAFCLGLLAGESALSLTAYVLSFAVFLDRGTAKARVMSLAPIASVCVAWRIAYKWLGYGAGGSAMYIDPAHDPLSFGVAALQRLPLLVQGQLLPLSPETFSLFASAWIWHFAAIAFVLSAAILWVCWRGLQRDSALAKFWLCGMLLSALPLCATLPHDRLLMPIGLGAFGLIAQFLGTGHERISERGVKWVFIVVHVVLAALLLPVKAYSAKFFGSVFDSAAFTLDNVGDFERRTLVIVNGPSLFHTSWASMLRYAHGLSMPDHQITLGSSQDPVEVTRLDDRTLELRPANGYVRPPLNNLLNDMREPFRVGDTFHSQGLRVRVSEVTGDGHPAAVECQLERSLNDPGYVLVSWGRDGYVDFTPPERGQRITTEPVSLSRLMVAFALRQR